MISATPELRVFHSSQRTENLSEFILGQKNIPVSPPYVFSYMEIYYMLVSSMHLSPFSGSKAR